MKITKKSFYSKALPVCAAALAFGACGDDGGTQPEAADAGQQSTEYQPFANDNFASQQARVAIYEELVAARKADGFDAAACGDLTSPATGTCQRSAAAWIRRKRASAPALRIFVYAFRTAVLPPVTCTPSRSLT